MAGFNINEWRSEISRKDILRTNKFQMIFTSPKGLQNEINTNDTIRTLEYWGEMGTLPGQLLATHDARRYGYGPNEKRPYVAVFTDLQLSFYSDAEGQIWKFFDSWLRLIVNSYAPLGLDIANNQTTGVVINNGKTIAPYEISFREDYITDVQIRIFDNTGKIKKIANLREAYPIGMSDIQLSWQDTNTVMRLPITFCFTDWFSTTPTEQPNI